MSGNAVSEVLDVESAFEAGGEEATERSNQRREARKEEKVEVVFCVWNSLNRVTELDGNVLAIINRLEARSAYESRQEDTKWLRHSPVPPHEDGVGGTSDTSVPCTDT